MAFDIEKYADTSEPVDWSDLDFGAFLADPLPDESLRSLRYMADVEYHTVCYLRDMLVTPSHRDEDVSTFMTMWDREEYWHGEAVADVLGKHGVKLEYDQLKARRLKLGWREFLGPVKQSLGATIVGEDYVAVHMTWGAVNEYSAVAAYRRLASLEPHPALAPLLQRIAQQETRHVAFYTTQARARLEASATARKITRLALERFWGPVGSTIMPETEVQHVMGHLFAGPEGRAEVNRLDRNVSRLPGLEGLTIFANTLDARGIAA